MDGMDRIGFDFLINLVDDCRVRRKDKNSSDDKASEEAANSARLNELKWVMAAHQKRARQAKLELATGFHK